MPAHSARSTSSGGRRSTSRLLASPTVTVSSTTAPPMPANGPTGSVKLPSNTNRASAQPATPARTRATPAASSAERQILRQHDPEQLRARGAERPEKRAFADPLEAARGECPDQHERAGAQREERHEPDGEHDAVDQPLQGLLHRRQVHGRDIGQPFGDPPLEDPALRRSLDPA